MLLDEAFRFGEKGSPKEEVGARKAKPNPMYGWVFPLAKAKDSYTHACTAGGGFLRDMSIACASREETWRNFIIFFS